MSVNNKAVQIISCVNHRFELHLEALQQILNADDLKERSVVVVSIAGSYRTGKSFLLNFFLQFLRAQVSQFSGIVFCIMAFNTSFLCSIKHTMYPIGLVIV